MTEVPGRRLFKTIVEEKKISKSGCGELHFTKSYNQGIKQYIPTCIIFFLLFKTNNSLICLFYEMRESGALECNNRCRHHIRILYIDTQYLYLYINIHLQVVARIMLVLCPLTLRSSLVTSGANDVSVVRVVALAGLR